MLESSLEESELEEEPESESPELSEEAPATPLARFQSLPTKQEQKDVPSAYGWSALFYPAITMQKTGSLPLAGSLLLYAAYRLIS